MWQRITGSVVALGMTGLAWAAPAELHYAIDASISPIDGELRSDVTVTVPAGRTASELSFVLGKRFELQPVAASPSATITVGTTNSPLRDLQKITVVFGRPAHATRLRFRYHGPLNGDGDAGRLGFTAQVLELSVELMWLPFPSQLDERFTVDADLRGIPADRAVVAQGTIERRRDRIHVRRRFGDIDFAFVAAPNLQSVVAPGIEFYAQDLQDPLVQILRKHALGAAEYEQKWFGPLPASPVRMVVVPRKGGGSYARTGYTVFAAGHAAGEPLPEISEPDRAAGVAHELAHAWWSPADALTDDYWLSESLAQYACLRYYEHAFGRAELDAVLVKMRETARTAGPVLGHGRASRVQLYQKGPVLLFDLEAHIGREKMDRVLSLQARHPPRKTEEFLATLRAVAGADAAREFESALRAP